MPTFRFFHTGMAMNDVRLYSVKLYINFFGLFFVKLISLLDLDDGNYYNQSFTEVLEVRGTFDSREPSIYYKIVMQY